jgi:hypothetical protein
MIIGCPTREFGPFDRFELTAGEFQRAFGGCGGGGEKYDRTYETCDHAMLRGLLKRAISLQARKCIVDKDSSSARANGGSGEPTQP